jgi:hypothetical protein
VLWTQQPEIIVRQQGARPFLLDTDLNWTVAHLKAEVCAESGRDELDRLEFLGVALNEQTIGEVGIRSSSTVLAHFVPSRPDSSVVLVVTQWGLQFPLYITRDMLVEKFQRKLHNLSCLAFVDTYQSCNGSCLERGRMLEECGVTESRPCIIKIRESGFM